MGENGPHGSVQGDVQHLTEKQARTFSPLYAPGSARRQKTNSPSASSFTKIGSAYLIGYALFRCGFAACYSMPLILFARWRLRILDLADPSLFSPARLADKRTLRPGPLVNHPAPEDEEGGPSPPLDSTLLRCVRTSAVLYLCSISFGPTADGTSSITPIVC